MFDTSPASPVAGNNPVPATDNLPQTKTPPPFAPPNSSEPEDIFKNVDPAPVPAAGDHFLADHESVPPIFAEPTIKSAPSIFKSPSNSKSVPPSAPHQALIEEAVAPAKTLDTKSIILLSAIALVIIGTVAAGIWWFLGYQKKKQANLNNSPAVNLFQSLASTTNGALVNNTNNLPSSVEPVNNLATTTDNLTTAKQDTDGDGLTDEEEMALGTTISAADTDNDGLSDREEVQIYKSDPLKPDTDNDGQTDGEEIKSQHDPLKAEAALTGGVYTNATYKFSFTPLAGLTLSSSADNLVLFNDDINQIKFYIYLDGSQPADLPSPDLLYLITLNSESHLTFKDRESLADQTPSSTEYSTRPYEASNGHRYTLRYVATKRASNHQQNFEDLLNSFQVLP